jgi:hypothetical protein
MRRRTATVPRSAAPYASPISTPPRPPRARPHERLPSPVRYPRLLRGAPLWSILAALAASHVHFERGFAVGSQAGAEPDLGEHGEKNRL